MGQPTIFHYLILLVLFAALAWAGRALLKRPKAIFWIGIGTIGIFAAGFAPRDVATPAVNSASAGAKAQSECVETAQSIASVTGARVVEAIPSLGAIFLRHPASAEIYLYCAERKGKSGPLADGSVAAISFKTQADPLPSDYFAFVASAGSVLSGMSSGEIRDTLMACMKAVPNSKLGTVYMNLGRFGFACDGGPTTSGRPYSVEMEGAFPEKALKLSRVVYQ